MSIGQVTGKFFNNPNNSGAFDVTPSTSPVFTQQFPVIDFNPPSGATVECSNSTGVDTSTRPFTDVIPQGDGSCTTSAAGSAGTGSMSSFEAVFTGSLTVQQSGQATFNFFADDGWVFAAGQNSGGSQPTYVSGSMVNAPASGAFTGYPVVGAYNQSSSPTQNTVTVNFPSAGNYPIEIDYTECCGDGLSLTVGTSYGNPILPQGGTGPTTPETYGAGSPSEHHPTCCAGDPVNTAMGNFSYGIDTLFVPGRGLPLHHTMTYDSLEALTAPSNTASGSGWTDSYLDFSLCAMTSGTCGSYSSSSPIRVWEEGGSQVTFYPTGSGYKPASRVLATLVHNADDTWTFTRLQTQDKYVFASLTATGYAGRLLKEIDRNGYTTTPTYQNGTWGLITKVTDSAGRSLNFTISSASHISSITDPAGRKVSLTYDTSDNLTSVTDATGGVTTFNYGANHLIASVVNPKGGITKNTYDSTGRVISQTDPLNRTTKFSYVTNADGSITTTVTDPKGNITKYQYKNNELLSVTRGANTSSAATWSFLYNEGTLGLQSLSDPNNHVWSNTWDSAGNVISRTDPLSRNISYTYDNLNDLTSVTDPMGMKSSMTYDANGNLLSVARPLLQTGQTATTTLAYGDPSHPGDVTQVTNPNGQATSFTYNTNGDRASVTDAMGDLRTYSYDNIGRVTSTVSPIGNVSGGSPSAYTSTYTYNGFGEVLTATDPLGNKLTYVYDSNQNLQSAKDARLNTISYSYDADNERTAVSYPNATSVGFAYDADGNVLSQTDGLQKSTSYSYDPLNRVSTVKDPLLRLTKYGYDLAGNLTSLTDPQNRQTTYGYDAANQLTSIKFSDGSTPNISFAYNNDGQRISTSDGTGTSSYTYDSLNRLTQSQNGAGQAVGYGYDLAGDVTVLTYPNGSQVTRTYDAARRLTQITDWLRNTSSFAYDANGNLTGETLPNNTTGAFSYNAADQLTQIMYSVSGIPFWTFGYSRDSDGQVQSASDPIDQFQHTLSYDALNRATSDARSSGTSSWTYNAADEVTGTGDTGSNVTGTLSYDSAHELTSLVSKTGATTNQSLTLTYNAEGDRTQQTDSVTGSTANYSYDQANELIGYTKNGVSSQYTYAGDGLRASKTVSGTTSSFVWDMAEGMPLLLQDGTSSYVTGPGGLPLEQISGSSVYYFYQDQLGSTRGLLDSSGNVVATYSYGAYGDVKSATGTVSTPFGYAGQYLDAESGLQYVRARYYDPATMQFVTVDPLQGLTGEAYVYTQGNPLNAADPTGMDSELEQECRWLEEKIADLADQAQNRYEAMLRDFYTQSPRRGPDPGSFRPADPKHPERGGWYGHGWRLDEVLGELDGKLDRWKNLGCDTVCPGSETVANAREVADQLSRPENPSQSDFRSIGTGLAPAAHAVAVVGEVFVAVVTGVVTVVVAAYGVLQSTPRFGVPSVAF